MAVATGARAGRRLVVGLDSLRDAIATAEAIRTSLKTLVDDNERITSSSEHPPDVAAK